MAYKKIDDSDLLGKGVINLADTPGLSAQQMQEKFEETSRSVIIPHFNQLIDTLTENGVPVKSEDIVKIKKNNNGDLLISTDGVNWVHSSGSALDKKADKSETYTKEETDHKLLLKADNDNVYSKKEIYTKEETETAISKRVNDIGSSDMTKAVYDTTNNGIVDNSEKLGGKLPNYYAVADNSWSLRGGISISNNTDLNTIVKIGNYYSNNWGVTLPNAPVNSVFTMKVYSGTGISDNVITQEVLSYIPVSRGLEYKREGTYDTKSKKWNFSEWIQTANTKDVNAVKTIANAAMPKSGGNFTGTAKATYSRGGSWNIKNNAVSDSAWNEVQENISAIRFIRK